MNVKRTILIIDDEVDLVDALSFQLSVKKGYEMLHAYDGVEGLEKLETVQPDLIILDINMPRMGGLEFYRRISDEDGKAKYPVLVLTARANLGELFKQLNVDGFIPKPFDLEVLFKEIDIIIKKRYETETPKKPAIAPTGPVKVLIVEADNKALDKIAIAFLNAEYSVTSANSSVGAINRLMIEIPDLILVRLGLPDLPGDILVMKLKQMPKMMDIPVVLYIPADDLNYTLINNIKNKSGIKQIVNSDDPEMLVEAAALALRK